jgi:short-subunit dehydrogenase
VKLTKDSVALITGANGGIGQAIARAIARSGARVIVSGRREDALRPIAEELGARVIVCDLAQRSDVDRLADEAGDVDVLVANAALPASGALLDFSVDEIDRAIEVNLRSPVVLARRLAEGMRARGRGAVVFISSIAGKVASPGSALYSATKFGLRGCSLGLRDDLYGTGVGVTTVFPGFIRDAGMFASAGVSLPAGVGTRSPDDVARAVLTAVRDAPAEIDVASFEQRAGAVLASLSPTLSSSVQRMMNAQELSAKIAHGQRGKR